MKTDDRLIEYDVNTDGIGCTVNGVTPATL